MGTEEYDVSFSQLIDCLESLASGSEINKDLWIYRGQSVSGRCL